MKNRCALINDMHNLRLNLTNSVRNSVFYTHELQRTKDGISLGGGHREKSVHGAHTGTTAGGPFDQGGLTGGS